MPFIIAVLLVRQAVDSLRSFRTTVLNAKVTFHLRRRLYKAERGGPHIHHGAHWQLW